MRIKSEVGHKFLRGIQARFAPYDQFQPIGWTGAPPIYEQPKRYPLPLLGRRVSESLNRDIVYGINDATRRPGLADPGLFNGQALAMPLDSDPAIQAQQLILRPRSSADTTELVNGALSTMAMFPSR